MNETNRPMNLKEMTLAQARELRGLRLSVMADRCPLRFHPVIITGPAEGYLVVELRFALANEFPIVR